MAHHPTVGWGEQTMAEHDLVIRNGTVIDGTGAERRTGDVAVSDGVITEVGVVDPAREPGISRR